MRRGSVHHFPIALVAAVLPLLVIVPRTFAVQNDCLLNFEGVPDNATQGGAVSCDDCNPACDTDGEATANKACTFNIRACANQPGTGCTAADLKKVKVKKVNGSCKVTGLKFTPQGTSSVCGSFTGVVVKTKKNGRKPGKCKIKISAQSTTKPRQKDNDVLTLTCEPQTATSCPTTTTTTTPTTTSTTTTTLVVCGDGFRGGSEACDDGNLTDNDGCDSNCTIPACGNGIVNPSLGEACDPPCGAGCTGGQICNSQCQCEAATACACGTPDPSTLRFTTTLSQTFGQACGTIQNATGGQVAPLACGGLYFGGGGDAVPLPAIVPDMGVSNMKACCSGTELTLASTSPTDTGNDRTCSGRDCFFGAPLPIPNTAENASAISTCVINKVAVNAVGTMECSTGESSLSLPLTSEVYLFGDLLNGATADRPGVPGIQPCPICSRVCAAGANAGLPCDADGDCPASTCVGSATCLGGPNHGNACTPASSITPVCEGGTAVDKPCGSDGDCPGSVCTPLRSPYPTTHDCPPPGGAGQPIGSLPIGFALTTGTMTKTAEAKGSQQRVFCGYCRDVDETFCFEGDPGSGCPASTAIRPCDSDADCAQPFEACEQKTQGAFAFGTANTLSATGDPAGAIATGNAPQPSTLVSIFCIPPTFNPAIDASADLPGPGAVALPGNAELLP